MFLSEAAMNLLNKTYVLGIKSIPVIAVTSTHLYINQASALGSYDVYTTV